MTDVVRRLNSSNMQLRLGLWRFDNW